MMRRTVHLAQHVPPAVGAGIDQTGLQVQRHLCLKIQYVAKFITSIQVDVAVLQIKNLHACDTKAALPRTVTESLMYPPQDMFKLDH